MARDQFRGKAVLITGGASGIGRAMALALTRAGANVTIADVDEVAMVVALKELDHAGGGRASGVVLDVRNEAGVRGAIDDIVDREGRIDFVFNNAGIVFGGFTHELTAAHWWRVIDVNLLGVVNGVTAAYPHMVRQRSGHIVNTASLAGLLPSVYVAAYSASKHAIVGLSGALRAEAAAHGVRVSVLCPGAVDTPILDAAPPSDLPVPGWTMTGREYMRRGGMPTISPERLATVALRGVARNRAVIVAPARARALWVAARMAPWAADRASPLVARRIAGEEGR